MATFDHFYTFAMSISCDSNIVKRKTFPIKNQLKFCIIPVDAKQILPSFLVLAKMRFARKILELSNDNSLELFTSFLHPVVVMMSMRNSLCVFFLKGSVSLKKGVGSHYVFLAGLELTMYTKLALNSQRSACLFLPHVGIKDIYHHAWPYAFI